MTTNFAGDERRIENKNVTEEAQRAAKRETFSEKLGLRCSEDCRSSQGSSFTSVSFSLSSHVLHVSFEF